MMLGQPDEALKQLQAHADAKVEIEDDFDIADDDVASSNIR
jgi:hypothetical protein